MVSGTLIYVHGGGPQDGERLHGQLDAAMGNRYLGRSRLALYADICWPATRALQELIGAIAVDDEPPETSADRLVQALVSAGSGVEPDDEHDLLELAAHLYDRAGPGGDAGRIEVRIAAGNLVRDLTAYLCDIDRTTANRMRDRIRDAIAASEPPYVVVAHSLGSLILYDVLAGAGRVRLTQLITVGSPLGFGFIQWRLRDRAGRPNPVPDGLRWSNFFDRLDVKVGWHPRLAMAFRRPNTIQDHAPVANKGMDRHDFPGYLGAPPVADAISVALDGEP